MRKISICSWCGTPFEIDENEDEVDVCGDCVYITEDNVGLLDDEDFGFLKDKD